MWKNSKTEALIHTLSRGNQETGENFLVKFLPIWIAQNRMKSLRERIWHAEKMWIYHYCYLWMEFLCLFSYYPFSFLLYWTLGDTLVLTGYTSHYEIAEVKWKIVDDPFAFVGGINYIIFRQTLKHRKRYYICQKLSVEGHRNSTQNKWDAVGKIIKKLRDVVNQIQGFKWCYLHSTRRRGSDFFWRAMAGQIFGFCTNP